MFLKHLKKGFLNAYCVIKNKRWPHEYFQHHELFPKKNKSAQIAKNRLHIIIAQEKSQKNSPDYLPMLRQEILKVVAKYTNANMDQVNIELHCKDNNAILELNVTLPDQTVAA